MVEKLKGAATDHLPANNGQNPQNRMETASWRSSPIDGASLNVSGRNISLSEGEYSTGGNFTEAANERA